MRSNHKLDKSGGNHQFMPRNGTVQFHIKLLFGSFFT